MSEFRKEREKNDKNKAELRKSKARDYAKKRYLQQKTDRLSLEKSETDEVRCDCGAVMSEARDLLKKAEQTMTRANAIKKNNLELTSAIFKERDELNEEKTEFYIIKETTELRNKLA